MTFDGSNSDRDGRHSDTAGRASSKVEVSPQRAGSEDDRDGPGPILAAFNRIKSATSRPQSRWSRRFAQGAQISFGSKVFRRPTGFVVTPRGSEGAWYLDGHSELTGDEP